VTPDRWRAITDLLAIARDLPGAEADAFLRRECGPDLSLYEEVRGMLDADSASGPLDRSPWSPAPVVETAPVFQAGDIVAGRFRIVRFVSRGGMGEVYEAEPVLLAGARVALKTLLPTVAGNPAMIARFKQEITLARKVVHGNVCPVYDFDRHTDGAYFLTMKYLPGETLAARIAREGPMAPEMAVPLLAQIAAALDAAHTAGVVHRDLKASNVILVPDEKHARHLQAVVTDFGLARDFAPGDSVTHTTQVLGTLDYMAPELFAGRAATLASDIFAFGVLAHKMTEGAAPNEPLNRLIRACLDPDPACRPGAAEILRRLPHIRPRRIRALPASIAALLLLSLSAVIFRYSKQGLQLPPGTAIYLTEMNNATQDRDLDSTGDLLRNHLRQSVHLRLLDDARIARARSLMPASGGAGNSAAVAREIALRAGATLVVFSTLARIGDTYDLNVEMQRAGGNPVAARKEWRNHWQVRSKPRIFDAVHDAGDWIRAVAGEAPASIAERDLPPEEAASNSWEALSLYKESEKLKAGGQVDAAIALLRRAVELDVDFALAHVRMGDYLSGTHRQEEAFQHYQLALSAGAKRRLTAWEELHLRGSYALDLGDYSAAEGAFTELRTMYPQDSLPPHYLAAAIRFQGRLEASTGLEQEAITRAPEATLPVVGLMGDYILLGRLNEAEQQARKLAEIGAGTMSVKYRGIIAFLRGDLAGAQSVFESVSRDSSPSQRSQGASLLAAYFAEKGLFRRAVAEYKAGAEADLAAGMNPQVAAKYLALAALHYRAHNLAEARTYCMEALRMQRRLDLYRRAGAILARSGFVADAQRLLDDLGPAWPGPSAEAARHQIRAEILLHGGDRQASLREFEAASRMDSPLHDREYLARAYAVTGDRERALFQYESAVRSPRPYWQYPDAAIPAFYTSTLLDYASLAIEGGDVARAESALDEFYRLRSEAERGLPETTRAEQLRADLAAAHTQRKD